MGERSSSRALTIRCRKSMGCMFGCCSLISPRDFGNIDFCKRLFVAVNYLSPSSHPDFVARIVHFVKGETNSPGHHDCSGGEIRRVRFLTLVTNIDSLGCVFFRDRFGIWDQCNGVDGLLGSMHFCSFSF
ncbi:hypothetical protein KSP40_PGU008208 [Platanthera guangdongensis]|uniref:Uncharacterized protein n=1 Tax=Platanthera guangdongensis TaxID=2320717 RepID=A0ABR2LTB5_9ASPA